MSEPPRQPTEPPLRAGVIGVGNMGRHHARVYAELAGVALVGVADADQARAAEIADRHGVEAVDRASLLERVDVVSVAVPTAYHYDLAAEAIRHGVDVLVEKPFVDDPAEGRELVAMAEDAGVVLQVGHVERFNPAVEVLAPIFDGLEVIAIDAERLSPPPNREIGDNAVLDLMIHDLDVMLALTDAEVERIEAVGARENRHVVATLQFDDGTVGRLTASRLTQQKVRSLSVTARECWIDVDYLDQSIHIHRHSVPEYIEQNGDLRYRHESIVERPTVENGEPLKKELAAFVEAARTGSEPVVTGEDGLEVLRIAREIDARASPDRRLPGVNH